MEEEETESAGQETNASATLMQVMAMEEPENEKSLPEELSPEEQIEILQARIKDLEKQVKDLHESKFGGENISNDPELLTFYKGFISKERFDRFYKWVEPYAKTIINWSQIQRGRGLELLIFGLSWQHITLLGPDQFSRKDLKLAQGSLIQV
ncbi:hypothetical protein AWC38_SpisGene24075 [Stylophora pistillata]|uniref:Uncharacterized protein n=1 Tax=Stylophora pistillata TaxID=50429 RepID=A0A2B4R6B3_STYPI|nr:hypothetical protein AWC38_SpisGene24075 [Stylophora pistillata]